MAKTRACKICESKLKILYKGMFDNRHGYPGKFDVLECQKCGFMQTLPQLTFRQLSSVYTNYYPKRDANIKDIVNSVKHMPTKSDIKRNGLGTTCHFQTKKGEKVLDVGCGSCQSLLEIKKLGGEAWGLDPDRNSQAVAKKLKLKFHLGTIHNCKFPKKYFDLVTASQVLEHEGNPNKFLSDAKRFIKDDGRIVLSFPNTGALSRKIWGRKWLHWHIPYHLNHFSKESVLRLADTAGLKVVSIKTETPNLWTVLQIRAYLSDVKEGQRDPMWDTGEQPVVDSNKLNVKSLLQRAMPVVSSLLVLNRVIDAFGLGESFVVELTKK